MRSSDFVNYLYDYRLNWTPLSPVTITYMHLLRSCKLSFGTGANVRKSIPNRIVKSRRRVGFSLCPALVIQSILSSTAKLGTE